MACEEHAADPQPSWCAECMETTPPKPLPAPEPWTMEGGAFVAGYPGDCPGCDLPIQTGALIRRWVRDDQTRYTHTTCRP